MAIDLGLFGERLTITPEFYWNTTRDLLYKSPIPSTTGYSEQMQNIGQVTNKGFELTINGTIIQKKDFLLSFQEMSITETAGAAAWHSTHEARCH